jgi:6-bladed beta-propeller
MTQAAQLHALIARAPRLALKAAPLLIHPPREGWELGMVSWAAVSRGGVAYLLQRGHKADPIVAVDPQGRVLQSWGNGMFIMPHSIRIDPQGNIWTTDAASSRVLKFTPEGTPLLEIAVGGQPNPCVQNFCGTTDVAFAPNGHIFITDGYINARVIEYTADGKKVRQWGEPGTGPGQFNLVHSLQIDDDAVIYVADRENTRIQRFDLDGHFLGEWTHLGKTFSLTIRQGALYIATQLPDQPNFAPGWLMKLDRKTGQILGWIESTGNHGLEATDRGELLIGPGNGHAQWFR